MGIQRQTYTIEAAPDWAALGATLEASMGVHIRIVRASASIASVRASAVAGSADVSFNGGHLDWETPLDANPYFVEHLHQALVGLGAKPLRKRDPRDEHRGVLWRALPLRQRVAHGLVGKVARAVLWVLMSPLIVVGLVVGNVVILLRRLVRKMLGV